MPLRRGFTRLWDTTARPMQPCMQQHRRNLRPAAAAQRNALSGQLPDEMGKLNKLHILRLAFNKLAFMLPRSWSGMASLRLLDLRCNALTGTLPLVRIPAERAPNFFEKPHFCSSWHSARDAECEVR